MDITSLTALGVGEKIRKKQLTVPEVTEAVLNNIKAKEAEYNSYITVLEEEAKERAKIVQKGIEQGEYQNSPLAGVPMGIKDNICTKDIATTCASYMLHEFKPPYQATVMDKLEAAGAILVGKLNMDEFGFGSTTENSYFGATKNPRNIQHVPGGSSGGSAAAVAGEEAFYTLGSDTGGSIRQPSAYCGITGIKPTYGTVSRHGLVAFASSLDQIGPMGKNISDCAAVLDIITGYDPMDSTSIKDELYKHDKSTYTSALIHDVKGMKIGIPRNFIEADIDEDIKVGLLKAVKVLEELGAVIQWFNLEHMEHVSSAYSIISSAEASSNLSRYDGIRYGYHYENSKNLQDLYKKNRSIGFGEEAKRRILTGTFVLSSEHYENCYKKAQKVRRMITESFLSAFRKYDIILGPTTPTTAPKLGDTLIKPSKRYLGDMYTAGVNLAGLPAISLPCGQDKKGLPIGLQLIGKHFGEKDIIQAAYAFEQTRYLYHP